MRGKLLCVLAAAALFAVPLAGCGGGDASTQVQNSTVSKGQALIDLKRALDAGAITPAEYEKQRQKLLNQ
jgi:hypothetical protein